MFAVPKDTQLLIFNLPLQDPSDEIKENVKLFEKVMTERTGIPCIVYDSALCEVNDFAIYQTLSPEFRELFDETRKMLDDKSYKETNQRKDSISQSNFVGSFCDACLSRLERNTFLMLSFMLGVLAGILFMGFFV